jgi:hypothetical protein
VTAVVVGVDPGLKKGSAVAVLDRSTGRVIAAQIFKAERWLDQPVTFGKLLVSAVGGTVRLDVAESVLVAELAQVYERRNQSGERKVDPNDLIDLAACAGTWCEAGRSLGIHADLVRPAVWKGGNTPKEIEAARIMARCSPEEIDLVQRSAPRGRHLDLWDAVGIAHWTWKRRALLHLPLPAGWSGNTPNGPFDP